ncbi:MAG TPA: phosphoribosylglycinamide formyltransferase [Polyangia bacterium]|jgi:phosphoribosylglycinamide formyltransferase-1
MTLAVGVLVSGGGTNLQAILDAQAAGTLGGAQVRVVISNRADAHALDRARAAGVEAVVVDHKAYADREAFEDALVEALRARGVELVALAGFMRLLTPRFLRAFPDRVVNIHPALLPSFPGVHAQRQALAYGVTITGCTVHFVDEGTDTGPIIAQAAVPVHADDDEDRLAARVLAEEHRIYPLVLRLLAEGRVERRGRRVVVHGAAAEAAALRVP